MTAGRTAADVADADTAGDADAGGDDDGVGDTAVLSAREFAGGAWWALGW
jgi:hypothetical protein